MSNHSPENSYTEEEIQANSRADALAIFSLVVIAVGLLVFFVATRAYWPQAANVKSAR